MQNIIYLGKCFRFWFCSGRLITNDILWLSSGHGIPAAAADTTDEPVDMRRERDRRRRLVSETDGDRSAIGTIVVDMKTGGGRTSTMSYEMRRNSQQRRVDPGTLGVNDDGGKSRPLYVTGTVDGRLLSRIFRECNPPTDARKRARTQTARNPSSAGRVFGFRQTVRRRGRTAGAPRRVINGRGGQ